MLLAMPLVLLQRGTTNLRLLTAQFDDQPFDTEAFTFQSEYISVSFKSRTRVSTRACASSGDISGRSLSDGGSEKSYHNASFVRAKGEKGKKRQNKTGQIQNHEIFKMFITTQLEFDLQPTSGDPSRIQLI